MIESEKVINEDGGFRNVGFFIVFLMRLILYLRNSFV